MFTGACWCCKLRGGAGFVVLQAPEKTQACNAQQGTPYACGQVSSSTALQALAAAAHSRVWWQQQQQQRTAECGGSSSSSAQQAS